VPTAERLLGFGLPLYSSGLPVRLRATFHGRDVLSGSCVSFPSAGGVIRQDKAAETRMPGAETHS